MKIRRVLFSLACAMMVLSSCGPTLNMTTSWKDQQASPENYNQVLVLAMVKDLGLRQLAENAIANELKSRGVTAVTSLDQFSPEFTNVRDSARVREMLLEKNIDAVLTATVVDVDEKERWVPGGGFASPFGFYRGFYSYYNFFAMRNTGYTTTDVQVLLESNFYNLKTNNLIWTGQSTVFTKNPSERLAKRYAEKIIDDLYQKNVIASR